MIKSTAKPTFHYRSTEIVEKGDVVKTGNGNYGVVELVISPNSSESKAYHCPKGGILINEDWGGKSSYFLMTPPDGIYWEDLEFIQRHQQGR